MNWDFEYVFFFKKKEELLRSTSFLTLELFTFFFSSADSLGATVDQQKASYDKLVADHPSTVLSLEHEVYGTFFASSIIPSVLSLNERLFHLETSV